MADEKDVLLEMFKQYLNQGLHHQQQRATVANIILILAGVIVGLITFDDHLRGTADGVAAFFLWVLGVFGLLWSAKQHERYAYYLERARGYRNRLDEDLPHISLQGINNVAEATTAREYGPLYRMQVWWIWGALYGLIACLGFFILFLILFTISPLLTSLFLGLAILIAIRRPDLPSRIFSAGVQRIALVLNRRTR